jgi:BTB/POZ domain
MVNLHLKGQSNVKFGHMMRWLQKEGGGEHDGGPTTPLGYASFKDTGLPVVHYPDLERPKPVDHGISLVHSPPSRPLVLSEVSPRALKGSRVISRLQGETSKEPISADGCYRSSSEQGTASVGFLRSSRDPLRAAADLLGTKRTWELSASSNSPHLILYRTRSPHLPSCTLRGPVSEALPAMASTSLVHRVGLGKYVLAATRLPKCRSQTNSSCTRFLHSGDFTDFTIICGTYRFKVHKLVLCAESKFFRKMCTGPFKVRFPHTHLLSYCEPGGP